VEFEFPASPAHLGEVRRAVRAGLHGRVSEEDLDDLLLALNEATTNAVLHGSGGSRVEVSVRLAEGWAEMTVVDRGQQRPEPAWRGDEADDEADDEDAPTAISGRGLWLMSRLVDEVRLEQVKQGTRVTLRHRLSDPDLENGLTA
jgi:anti-sigma regulatory factor (Ser/Thr protein kinase)